jgi:3-oxoacyl-[acyl-carrier protein] reductase
MSDARGVLAGRVALVTGGSGGIGAALCRRLGLSGARVAVHFRSGREAAEEVARSVRAAGGEAQIFAADLADPAAPGRLVDEVRAALGPVDVLVANAGFSRRAGYEEVDAALFDETLAVNLRAPFLLAQGTLPHMRGQHFGRVLFTSSIAAITGGIVGPHYAASKAGLHGLTHFLAARVAADGVTVNAIAPALVAGTGMLPGEPAELTRLVPVGRLGTTEEVADLAMAMLANGYLTSKVFALDGGIAPR